MMVEPEGYLEEENSKIVSEPGPLKIAVDKEMLADGKPVSQVGDETQSTMLKVLPCRVRATSHFSKWRSAREITETVLSDKLGLYNQPKNCEGLVSTKVNPLIWDKLKSESRSNGVKMRKVQTLFH